MDLDKLRLTGYYMGDLIWLMPDRTQYRLYGTGVTKLLKGEQEIIGPRASAWLKGERPMEICLKPLHGHDYVDEVECLEAFLEGTQFVLKITGLNPLIVRIYDFESGTRVEILFNDLTMQASCVV